MVKDDIWRLHRLEQLLTVELQNPDIDGHDKLFIEYGIDVINGRETNPWLFVDKACGDAKELQYPMGIFLIKFIEFDPSWFKEGCDPVISSFLERAKKLALDKLEKIVEAKQFLSRVLSVDFELGLLAGLLFPLCHNESLHFNEHLTDLWSLIKERDRVVRGNENGKKRSARTRMDREKDRAYFALFDAAAVDYKPTFGGVKNFLKGLGCNPFSTEIGITFSIDGNRDIVRSDRKKPVLEGELNRKLKKYKDYKARLVIIEAHNKKKVAR